MLACLDVDYRDSAAVAACVLFEGWTDESPASELTVRIEQVAPYVPGSFYQRELPCLLAALERAALEPECVVVDGYVWLAPERPGLGAKLFEALGSRVPVVGVAKTAFAGAESIALPVLRGESQKPLLVTAAGMEPDLAAERVRSMHGRHRIPTLLKRVDRLCREG